MVGLSRGAVRDCIIFCAVGNGNWGNDRVLELEFEMALALALRTNAA